MSALGSVAVIAAAVAVLGLPALLSPTPGEPGGIRDPECAAAFPEQLDFPAQGDAIARLVVCTNEAHTAMFVLNRTRAVWTVLGNVSVFRTPMSSANASFASVVSSAEPMIPSGGTLVVLASPDQVVLRLDPRLTVAQLAHDQLTSTLGSASNELMWAAFRPDGGSARHALVSCLDALVDRAGDPDTLLRTSRASAGIAEAAAAAAAASWSGCGANWLAAKLDAGLYPGKITSLAYDVSDWDSNAMFEIRSNAASVAYREVSAPEGHPLPDS
ncbi:MAG: hypothetical protein JWR33_2060 [Naasia sp.]|jgi:hypothetical protein|uniref:hypothetical protein n=1 Tax=Naasia sp. TaxID=2546198 RepID=UPI00260F7415|nr:hypothetical protein [Naasia sp.]MCU1571319.1 hypothetical protein [Naasia sp.]